MTEDTKGGAKAPPITGEMVRQWFVDAVGNRGIPTPSLAECTTIASNLEHFRKFGAGSPDEAVLGDAEKHGRLFLQHLPVARAKIERVRADRAVPAEAQAGFLIVLAEMEAARKHVENVLTLLDWPLRRPSWHDTARLVLGMAWTAWATVGKRPKSLLPDDPPVFFVHAALTAIGVHASKETVSSALRGRRGATLKTRTKRGTKNVHERGDRS